MIVLIHAFAATVVLLTVATFMIATVVSELALDHAAVAAVKHAIVVGLAVLIPALIITGGSGFTLSRRRQGRLVKVKQRRMPFIVLIGLLILLPAAVFLRMKALAAEFDSLFFAVQGIELLFGAIQLTLLSLNFRDGLRLRGRRFGGTASTVHGDA